MAAVAARAAPAGDAEITVTGTRIAARAMDSTTAVTVVGDAESEAGSIVVTGGRAPRAAARGDWNACTVDDPEQSLRGCRQLLGIGKKGDASEAGEHLSKGLARAWQQDWRGAIARFDQAVALQPRLAFAYLNRGLAYRHLGELDRAAADLDLAVRYAGHSARSYYHRGTVRRLRGDGRGARADMARAEALDPRYGGLSE